MNSSTQGLLLRAAEQGDLVMMGQLLWEGADLNGASLHLKETALIIAVRKGHLPAVKWLLDHGADPNKADNDGMVPLHFAASRSRLLWTALVDAGALDTVAAHNGMTPRQLRWDHQRQQQKGMSCGL